VATEIVMPKMGYDMTEGKLVRWFKRDGDSVAKGEAVAEIETDKVVIEVEAFSSGVLRQIEVREGETAAVGARLALLAAPGEDLSSIQAPTLVPAVEAVLASSVPTPSVARQAEEQRIGPAPSHGQSAGELSASPLARREARERGVDLTNVQGTGPGGRITREDVIAAADRPAEAARVMSAPREPESIERADTETPVKSTAEASMTQLLSRLQQTIGRHMVESKTTAPHFYVTVHADMTDAMAMREQLNAGAATEARISVNDMVVKAVARALVGFPSLNATFAGDKLTLHQEVAVCVAVALEDGLVTPVVHHAEQMTLHQIARETHQLVERARAGKGRAEDYEGGTFTVSNLGMFNVDTFIAIINPPQAAILAVGAVNRLPVYVGEDLLPRLLMSMTLSADHRMTDGASAARFLARVCEALQQPTLLLK
jgi:pyruvate dehydrogenase E2 component (dihydrolipoamide acetyltransferase)